MKDIEIIKQIEKELNIKLEELGKLGWGRKGYTLNQNREVIGLSLLSCEIENLNCVFSPLKDLTNLTNLVLSTNQLSDISPLKDLTRLTKLYLRNNQLSDISPLKDLTNLTNLDLSTNQLSDIVLARSSSGKIFFEFV